MKNVTNFQNLNFLNYVTNVTHFGFKYDDPNKTQIKCKLKCKWNANEQLESELHYNNFGILYDITKL